VAAQQLMIKKTTATPGSSAESDMNLILTECCVRSLLRSSYSGFCSSEAASATCSSNRPTLTGAMETGPDPRAGVTACASPAPPVPPPKRRPVMSGVSAARRAPADRPAPAALPQSASRRQGVAGDVASSGLGREPRTGDGGVKLRLLNGVSRSDRGVESAAK